MGEHYKSYFVWCFTVHLAEAKTVETFCMKAGALGFERLPTFDSAICRAYWPETSQQSELQLKFKRCFVGVKDLEIRSVALPIKRGEANSSQAGIFEVASGLWVVPVGEKPPLSDVSCIKLHLGMAFGTGRHESTQLVAALLARLLKEGSPNDLSLLDVGTGSGVLALAAFTWGVRRITALEIDETARLLARKNFDLNQAHLIELLPDFSALSHLKKAQARSTSLGEENFSLIVANLPQPSLIYLQEQFKNFLAPGGRLIISGVLPREEKEFLQSYASWQLERRLHQGDYLGFCLRG